MKEHTKAHLAFLGTNLFFGANFSLIKIISPSLVKPMGLSLLRVGLSLFLFWLMWIGSKTEWGIKKKDIGRFILCGFTGVALNQILFLKGLSLTSTIHASLLMLVTPILVTIFALWILKEHFSVYKALGLALGVGGAAMLVLQKEKGSADTNYFLGDLLIIINAISYAIYFILVKPLMQHYSPLRVIRWVFTFGFIMVIPFGWQETIEVNWMAFQWSDIAAFTIVIVFGTFLAYFFNAYGIQHLGAGTAGAYIYTQPVFAVIIAMILLGEQLSWLKVFAGLMIFAGVYFVSFRKK
jgi:drug/metabolite transporter (DMT)-like permease